MSSAAQLNQAPSPEKIREATRAVLDRPEFAEPSPWHEFLFDIINAIKAWLDRLGSWSEANPNLARILFVVALLILLLCLGHMLYLALADVLPFRRRKENTLAQRARWEILEGAAANWHEALQVARAVLKQGNARRAIWIAHRVLLGLLDEQGAVKFAGWKTNSRYLVECAHNHPWHATLAEVTALYEQVVYASRQISIDVAEALVLRIDRMCNEAGRLI
jgi:hypothetical protein